MANDYAPLCDPSLDFNEDLTRPTQNESKKVWQKDGLDIERTAKLLGCGLIEAAIPFCDAVLEFAKQKPDSSINKLTSTEIMRIATSLFNIHDSMEAFIEVYPDWEKERSKCIEDIMSLVDNIKTHHRNISIAQLPTAGVGIAGGALAIAGVALIPVTLGISAALAITGSVLGIGSAVTGITTSATDIGIQMSRVKEAKKIVNQHKESTEKICMLSQMLAEHCSEVENMLGIKDALIECCAVSVGVSFLSVKSIVAICKDLAKTIPGAVKKASATATAKTSLVGTVYAAHAIPAATKALTGVGYAFGAIGIVADIVSAGMAIRSLAKGSKTSTSKQLQDQANNLRKEMEAFKELYTELQEHECNLSPMVSPTSKTLM